MLDKLLSRIPSHKVDVWCSEDYMSPTAPPGTPPPDTPTPEHLSDWWDVRPAEDGGQQWLRMHELAFCKNEILIASIRAQPTGSTDFIKMCPGHLDRFIAGSNLAFDLLAPVRRYDNGVHLDQIRDASTPVVLLHELSHSIILLEVDHRTSMIVDLKGQDKGYYWREVIYHATNNAYNALKNADNFAYFVLAMYLHKNHWATGLSEPTFNDGPARDSPP
ncbi:putative Protein kinase [Arthroderma uncinatum]|uniref:putative Protein kinase n=1 Tax=Arthroderma uncinatum TaxID=74035 RepID=UPI00144AAD1E|nr:putative Protein kinase [Arthroderma uncinatum]KAF3480777.1 putative Protein kinase [Arthroderma uncinatum]